MDEDKPHIDDRNVSLSTALVIIAALVFLISNGVWLWAYMQQTTQINAANDKITGLQNAAPAATPTPTATPAPGTTGTITGNVGFPASTAPAQTVCAVNTKDSHQYCIAHPGGTGYALGYQITVPAGTYRIYSSLKVAQGDYKTDYKAYFNKYVSCGMEHATCSATLHTQYNEVTVAVGGTAADIDPTDWYAQ